MQESLVQFMSRSEEEEGKEDHSFPTKDRTGKKAVLAQKAREGEETNASGGD